LVFGQVAHQVSYGASRVAAPGEKDVGDDECSGVDERVRRRRRRLIELQECIEAASGRDPAHASLYFGSVGLQGRNEREELADALDGEAGTSVARVCDARRIYPSEGDAQCIRPDLRESRYI
jgi:hypothetical protein